MTNANRDVVLLKACKDVARFKYTLRHAAKEYRIGKLTLHKYIHKELINVNKGLYDSVIEVLENNLKLRAIRGGEATARRFGEIKKKIKDICGTHESCNGECMFFRKCTRKCAFGLEK